jgi:O-antigen ligase
MTSTDEKVMSVWSHVLTYCQAKKIVRPDADWADALAAIVIGIAPLFYLTIKSWTNGALLVLFLLSLYGAFQRPDSYRALWTDKRVLWLAIALGSAFVAILVSQILRLDIQSSAYDGPLRPLAGILILLHLTVRKVNFTRILQWTCPLSVLICALEVWLNTAPTAFWGNRWATYFVDPLTFGQYSLLLGFLSLFMINLVEKDGPVAIALKLSAFIVGLGLSIGSESRSAWVALPVLFAIWLIAIVRLRDIKFLLASFVALAVGCLLAYLLVDFVHLRVDAAISNTTSYFDGGNRDTPVGLRLSLWRAAWHLFLMQPLHGFGDSGTPPLRSIPAIASYYTPALEFMIVHNGAHSELMQNMIRSGIFGLISTALMFIVPLVVFWSAARSPIRDTRTAGFVGLGYIAAVICFSLSTEAFNLKFLASFYALMVAALAAQAIWACPRQQTSSDGL